MSVIGIRFLLDGVIHHWPVHAPTLDLAGVERIVMEQDEASGLRAFALNVGLRGIASDPVRPLWIEVAGRRVDVASIDSEWHEDERLGFRVKLSDASMWLLYYVPALDLWSGVADTGVERHR